MVWHSRWIEGISDQSGGKTVLAYVARKEKGDQTSPPTKTGLFQSPALSESRRSAEGIDGTKKCERVRFPSKKFFLEWTTVYSLKKRSYKGAKNAQMFLMFFLFF